ncbi:MAG: sulfite exporter TauE/SafE family protein [Verrucomicrobiota bacterium]
MKTSLLALLLGAVSGLVAALCGVGGGIILVPAFEGILKLSHKQAIASSLAIIIPTAILATTRNASGPGSLIQWSIVLPAAAGAALAAWFGIDLMRTLSNQQLTRIFAILLILTGVRMLIPTR